MNGFACPGCRKPLHRDGDDLACACGARYQIENGVPLLAVQAPTRLRAGRRSGSTTTPTASGRSSARRAPRAFYRWLMREKCGRAVEGVALVGRSALVVCAGSGMDAEFLARAGADVIALDISRGAARRSLDRARRQEFQVVAAVGDAARLPFAERSIDVVYVHDGLHHLADPSAGVDELAGVARDAVCISEPARARITLLAVKLGLALEQEDAGNVVARLDPAAVSAALRARGFDAERYGMYYRHAPGRAVRLLSRPALFRLAAGALRLVNALAGALGNKLVVVGVRL